MPNFHLSAEDISLEDGHILHAKVANEEGEFLDSQLDLDYYIGNDDGNFQWGGESKHLLLICPFDAYVAILTPLIVSRLLPFC